MAIIKLKLVLGFILIRPIIFNFRFLLSNSGHEVGVTPTAVTATLESFGPFNFKAKFFVKMDGGRIVGVNFQLNAREIEPIVGHIHEFFHELAGDA